MTTLSGPPAVSARNLLTADQIGPAVLGSLKKLHPRDQLHQPVIFVVWVGSVFSTVLAITDPTLFGWLIAAWLWLTVLCANFAESVAEGRGKAQAASLRRARTTTTAHLTDGREVPAASLQPGAEVVVVAGQVIPETATSSRASPASTSRPSPASPRRSSASPAATARR